MALALYRKYRPRTFAEVIGQEHVTEPLMQALRTGRLNHAYLFSGPRGCGKTSSARILARSLNCEKGPTPEPCGACDSCVALAPDGAGSLDVIEIDAASHGGVDDARDLRERAFFAPVASREPRPVPPLPPRLLRRGEGPRARHRPTSAGALQWADPPRLPVLRSARMRQDLERAHPGPLAQLREGPDARPV